MDGHNSILDQVIREITMTQGMTFAIEAKCECGQVHRIPLDGFRACPCGRKVVSRVLTELINRTEG